jgi:sphingolipid delta-4 desaturase
MDEKVGITSRLKRNEGGRIVGSGSKWSQAEVEA